VIVEDIRAIDPTFVFAGYLDMMYDSGSLRPSNTDLSDQFDFDVEFGPGYVESAAVGTAARPGIIDEFGTLFQQTSFPPGTDLGQFNPGLLATVFFDAVAATPVGSPARVVGGPADSSPFQDTLLFGEDDPISVSRIQYDVLNITVNSFGSSSVPAQNLALPQDVNNDGFVTPIDALVVINEMSRASLLGEGETAASVVASTFYTDVNGDQRVSALDALQVINFLTVQNNQSSLGEGELIAPLDSTGTDLGSDVAADAVFADLSGSELAGDSPIDAGPAASASLAPAAAEDEDGDEDDSDEMFDLLADDVSALWS
jgi:hypothetical protein